MSKHPIDVEGFDGSLEELAKQIARMRYDSLSILLGFLAVEVHNEANKDRLAGRVRLSQSLYSAMRAIQACKQAMDSAWEISRPFMKTE